MEKDKLTIRFYNNDVWITYKDESEAHTIHLRVPYGETRVYFTPVHEESISERYVDNPLKTLRVGHYQERILKELM